MNKFGTQFSEANLKYHFEVKRSIKIKISLSILDHKMDSTELFINLGRQRNC